MFVGQNDIYNFMTLSLKDYYLIVDPDQNAYKFVTLSPKDYCLIPGNFAIKFVETQKSPIVNHFQFWFRLDTLQVHRSASNKMDISRDIDPTEISEF